MNDERRNLVFAIALSMAVLITWQLLVEAPPEDSAVSIEQTENGTSVDPTALPQPQAGTSASPAASPSNTDIIPQIGTQPVTPTEAPSVLASASRVPIRTPRLMGHFDRVGLRIDDLLLRDYRETVDPTSQPIRLFHPQTSFQPYYAEFGWISGDSGLTLPNAQTIWEFSPNSARELTENTPVTLQWSNDTGQTFRVTIALDSDYLFTITREVVNSGASPIAVAPYGLVSRTGTPALLGFYLLHEGFIGAVDERLIEEDYDDVSDEQAIVHSSGTSWMGITDKYWLAALIPSSDTNTSRMVAGNRGVLELYQVDTVGQLVTVGAGERNESVVRLYAGAKEVALLDAYAEAHDVQLFDRAVDFGWFYFITKPIFQFLSTIQSKVGNFGVSILILTVIVKLLFLPLVYKSYKSMARLRELQPEMEKLRERAGDDKKRMQKGMMELYRKNKVNPVSGCLPMLVQIPVFFALYKVLFVTIEMRHSPFFGWIQDLSAPDPAGILVGFGWIPWDVPAILTIVNLGIWPLIFGATMFLQQRVMPQPTDPLQKRIFGFFPYVFTLLLGGFPAGLVIYWSWNNTLTIIQQLAIQKINSRQRRAK